MRAITEMRAVVDGFAARYAAARVAGGAVKRDLLDGFFRLQQAVRCGELPEVAEADRSLHLAVVELAGVEGLREVWEAAAEKMENFRVESIRVCWPDLNVLLEAHRPIVDAICAGDQVLAADAAHAHLDAVWYRLADYANDPSLPDDPVARACTYLDFHLHETLPLNFLAAFVAKTSAGHLARMFKQQRGVSYTAYLRELRMQKGADLLRRTTLQVQRIAARVGYGDPSRFTSHFRARFNLSPRDFRRKFRLKFGNPKSP